MKDLNHRKANRPVHNVIFRILMCILVLAAGTFGMSRLAGSKKPPATAKSEERALRVEAVRMHPVDVPVTITGYGEVQALKVVTISPEVSGTLVEVHPRLDAGEIIPRGETLFRVDTRNYDAAATEAQANVMQWENAVERLEKQYAVDRRRLHTLQRNRDLAGLAFQQLYCLVNKPLHLACYNTLKIDVVLLASTALNNTESGLPALFTWGRGTL